jgi:hypothetical protein
MKPTRTESEPALAGNKHYNFSYLFVTAILFILCFRVMETSLEEINCVV